MVASLAAGRYSELRKIPFRDFRISFDDSHLLQIIRVDAPREGRPSAGGDLALTLFRGNKKEDQATLPALPADALTIPQHMIERTIPFLSKIGPSLW